MALYRASIKSQAFAANTNVLELRAPSTRRIEVRKLELVAEAATATFIAVYRSTVVGTAGTAVAGQPLDPRLGASTSSLVTGPTGGTLAAVAMARWQNAAIGAAVAWDWPAHEPFIIDPALSMILRSDGTLGAAHTINIEWDE